MFTVHFKNGNMLPIKVHDELTLTVILSTGSVYYVTAKNSKGEVIRRDEDFLNEYYNLNS